MLSTARSSEQVRVTVVTCLAFEARIAAGHGVSVVCNGRRERLHDLVQRACESSGGLISFGVAGGLDPGLRPGDWVIASNIVTEKGRYRTDEHWSRRLCAALPAARHADICGSDAPLASAAMKRALGQKHGTMAIDTESHVVAEEATRRGVPFAAARVVLDPVWQGLPPAALVPLMADGTPDIGGVARSVLLAPSQVGELGKITAHAFRAWFALRKGRAALGPLFSFGDAAAERELAPASIAEQTEPELSSVCVQA